jgi:outer membrane lipoprotein-sorting protein
MKFTKFAALTLAAGLLAAALPVMAQPVPAPTADSIMQRIEARDATLQSFQTRVHVNVHMLSFPWFSPQLDGTSYFKRPDNYMVHFDRVPSYAHGITKLFGDIGDPAAWQKDSNISFDGLQSIDGKPMLVLRMTKKIYSDQIKDTLAYVDPATYQVTKMVWNYTNGGSISMTQNFRPQGRYSVIATQHADIKIPHVHAVADATYGTYQMNVAIADSVFKQK